MTLPSQPWMYREIYQQPEALQAALDRYLDAEGFRLDASLPVQRLLEAKPAEIVIAASGSSRHAGMVAELLLEDFSGLPVDVEYASEYCCRAEHTLKHALVLVLSQSGETADTLAALRKAAAAGHPTLAITNVAGSTMAREAAASFPTEAGIERAVPATKSFTAQLLNVFLLALLAARARDTLTPAEIRTHLAAARRIPDSIRTQLPRWEAAIQTIAASYTSAASFLFLGRGVHYPVAREGALKLKESAYLHAEGYPSGELRHGPNALVSDTIPLVMIATADPRDPGSLDRYNRVLHLMATMRRQGANILAIANTGDTEVPALATHTVFVDPTLDALLPICEVVPLQLFAYFMARARGIDVDHPRNLTKAVLGE